MGLKSLEEMARLQGLPTVEALGLEAMETDLYLHYKQHPGEYLVLADADGFALLDRQGDPFFDKEGLDAYHRDIQGIYDIVFEERTGERPERNLSYSEVGFRLVETCIDNPLPVISRIPADIKDESDLFPIDIARALVYDMRYAAKLAEDDAKEYLKKPKMVRTKVSLAGAAALSVSMMLASFIGTFFGVSYAVDYELENVKTELRQEANKAINQARRELREEIDDAVIDYTFGHYFGSDENSD